MKRGLTIAAASILSVGIAQAGTLTVANSDIEMSGGVTAGYFYKTNIGNTNNDEFVVSNFSVGLKSKKKDLIGFVAYFGSNRWEDLIGRIDNKFKIKYAWVSIKPIEGLTIDAGKILTNIGYELYNSYENKNYIYGLVWWGQPVTYPGARATYSVADGIDVYVEYNQDVDDAFAVGSLGEINGINYAVSYFDYSTEKNLIDIVLSTSLEGIDFGVNFDYQWLDDSSKVAGNDDTAYGIALYLSTKVDVFEIPVRIEYVNDGTSGIYGIAGDDAWSFTVTPTYRPSDNTFVRAEFAYVNTDGKGFVDDKGNLKDSRTFLGVEAGFLF